MWSMTHSTWMVTSGVDAWVHVWWVPGQPSSAGSIFLFLPSISCRRNHAQNSHHARIALEYVGQIRTNTHFQSKHQSRTDCTCCRVVAVNGDRPGTWRCLARRSSSF